MTTLSTLAPSGTAGPSADGRSPVGIVGGGIMGIALGYFLARRGIACEIFEASPVMGGLAGPLSLPDGTVVDRYYHAILSSDAHLMELCRQLDLTSQLRFKETRTAVFVGGGLHSMNTVMELLRFKPLPFIDRLRLGLTVAGAQFYRDWHRLEAVNVERWLTRLGGAQLFGRLWKPMLAAKFDGAQDGVRATWMWARLVRMKSTRDGASQRERAGHLVGGYPTLLSAMAATIRRAGGHIHLSCPVNEVVVEQGRVAGLRIGTELHRFSQVAITMQGPVAARLLPGADPALRARLTDTPYLGIVCPIMVLDRPLTGVWTVNIADPSVPFTGVIETTTYIDPTYVGGHHLVYVPKYTAPGSAWLSMSDEEVRRVWLDGLKRMFPHFSEASVRYFMIHRERYVDPLHKVGAEDPPGIETSIDGLCLATTSQVYPALTSGESVTRHASAAADVMARHAARQLETAAFSTVA